jgi:hypothetical protein
VITVKRKATFVKAKLRRASAEAPLGRVPRVARLMALAIRFDQLIRDGVVADQAELARLGCVTRARTSQIMDLLNLAPDIQGLRLLLPTSPPGRPTITERSLRHVTADSDWRTQRRQMCAAISG